MTAFDLILAPLAIFFLMGGALLVRPMVTNGLTKSYFIPALTLKFVGAIALGLIYTFYYGGGDTLNYYYNSSFIYKALLEKPMLGIEMLLSSSVDVMLDSGEYTGRMYFRNDVASFFVVRVSAFMGLFCFNSYSVISLLFAALSFSGAWVLYLVYSELYPYLSRKLAVGLLFIPSVFFWGSGLMKDTLTYAAMGWVIWSFYTLVIKNRFSVLAIVSVLLASYVLMMIKIYILICLIPMLGIWWYLSIMGRINNKNIKMILAPFILVIFSGVAIYGSSVIASTSERYSYDKVVETAKVTAWWLKKVSNESDGSGYTLSRSFDGSLSGTLILAPQAINVTYFRPYLWEVKNPVMLMSAVESLIIFIFFMKVLFSKKQYDPLAVAGMAFAFIFAIAIGISTYNFGSLVRYKIPSMVIFVASLVLLKKSNHSSVES